MGRKSRRGGQYLSNVGFSNGYATPHTPGFLRGTDVGLANPTPFGATRTMAGGGWWSDMVEKVTSLFTKKPDAQQLPGPVAGGRRRSRRGGFRWRSRRTRR